MGFQEPIHILLVDDRPENLLALEAVLESQHYELVKATSGEEALRCLLRYDFAVIVLDVQMPGMDGIETAKLIKAREKQRKFRLSLSLRIVRKRSIYSRAILQGLLIIWLNPSFHKF